MWVAEHLGYAMKVGALPEGQGLYSEVWDPEGILYRKRWPFDGATMGALASMLAMGQALGWCMGHVDCALGPEELQSQMPFEASETHR